MEVPRPGSNGSYSHCPQPQIHQIQAASVTYTTAHGDAGYLTQWARPGIEAASSWILVGFDNHWAMKGPPSDLYFWFSVLSQFWAASLPLLGQYMCLKKKQKGCHQKDNLLRERAHNSVLLKYAWLQECWGCLLKNRLLGPSPRRWFNWSGAEA